MGGSIWRSLRRSVTLVPDGVSILLGSAMIRLLLAAYILGALAARSGKGGRRFSLE